jgi:hypothetical protein
VSFWEARFGGPSFLGSRSIVGREFELSARPSLQAKQSDLAIEELMDGFVASLLARTMVISSSKRPS